MCALDTLYALDSLGASGFESGDSLADSPYGDVAVVDRGLHVVESGSESLEHLIHTVFSHQDSHSGSWGSRWGSTGDYREWELDIWLLQWLLVLLLQWVPVVHVLQLILLHVGLLSVEINVDLGREARDRVDGDVHHDGKAGVGVDRGGYSLLY